MKAWNKENYREELLRTGMGCFVFAAGMTFVNVMCFPIGRDALQYHLLSCLSAFFCTLAACWLLARVLGQAKQAQLESIRRVAVPTALTVFFILQVVLGYWMEYTPSGDNFMIYGGSRMLAADGCFDREPGYELYLSRFPNQWGFLLLCTAVWKVAGLFGAQSIFMPMIVLQALVYIPGILSLLSIARKSRGIRAELMLLLMVMTCLPLYLAAGVLYTDTFSLPFMPMALNLAMNVMREKDRKKQMLSAVLCGVVVMIGSCMKMTVLIVLFAAMICWMLTMRPMRAALYGAVCVAIFLLGNTALRQVMLSRAIDRDLHEQQNTPAIHWIMMSIPSNNRPYNPWGGATNDYGITWEMMDRGASHEEVMDSIYSRMKDKIYTLRYPNRLMKAALYKNVAAFADGTFGMTEMLDDRPVRENWVSGVVLLGRPGFSVYQGITSGMFYAYLLLSVYTCIRDIRRRNVSMAMGYVAVFGGMLFLMLWEARTRYFLGFVPIILLLCSMYAADRDEESIV